MTWFDVLNCCSEYSVESVIAVAIFYMQLFFVYFSRLTVYAIQCISDYLYWQVSAC